MEPPIVGLLDRYVSTGRGRLVHRRKTKEKEENSARQRLILADSPSECQRPCSDAPARAGFFASSKLAERIPSRWLQRFSTTNSS